MLETASLSYPPLPAARRIDDSMPIALAHDEIVSDAKDIGGKTNKCRAQLAGFETAAWVWL